MKAPWRGRPAWPLDAAETISTAWPWLDLASPTATIGGTTPTVVSAGAQDADGYHTVTVTGSGSVRDGYNEVTHHLFPVSDRLAEVLDPTDPDIMAILFLLETSGTLPSNGTLVHVGIGAFDSLTAPTSVAGVLYQGFDFDGTPSSSRITGTSASNATTGATGATLMRLLWLPDRSASGATLGTFAAAWESATAQAAQLGSDVSTVYGANPLSVVVAYGQDTTDTTPTDVTLRVGAIAIRMDLP